MNNTYQTTLTAHIDVHPDDKAVDRLAAAMKRKLAEARRKGRGGWETCPPQELSLMLREHVEKGDPRDVANFCAFLWALGEGISLPPVGTDNFDLWVSRGMGATPAMTPRGFLLHWPKPGGGREPVWSDTDAAGVAVGCPVEPLFSRGIRA